LTFLPPTVVLLETVVVWTGAFGDYSNKHHWHSVYAAKHIPNMSFYSTLLRIFWL